MYNFLNSANKFCFFQPKRINNSFRFGGDSVASGSRKQSRDSSRRSSRQSSDGSPGATPIRGDRSSTPAKEGPVLVLPLPADMIRPLSRVNIFGSLKISTFPCDVIY